VVVPSINANPGKAMSLRTNAAVATDPEKMGTMPALCIPRMAMEWEQPGSCSAWSVPPGAVARREERR
jgi:hypothetical protein